MTLTEEEAKEKWCPFARVTTLVDDETLPSLNRTFNANTGGGHNNLEHARCFASECMAWRWAIGSDDVGGYKRVNPEDNRKLGSCGLAGKVE